MGHKIPHCFKAIMRDRCLFLVCKYKIIINLLCCCWDFHLEAHKYKWSLQNRKFEPNKELNDNCELIWESRLETGFLSLCPLFPPQVF